MHMLYPSSVALQLSALSVRTRLISYCGSLGRARCVSGACCLRIVDFGRACANGPCRISRLPSTVAKEPASTRYPILFVIGRPSQEVLAHRWEEV
ncbi:uncharacterized protein M421DRAFT_309269 [Didymella exigua CBS 183.55]|uniref:Uncharacterized protein n=1 Tax=Didymella exigua CBS 183.55 TaxID=1150837 RepID=A0A6A5R9A2_9PLEO|nr:uncharacterized protein M421DRAFT_309269 [Didymella exigua CBS 183.55]KAF1923584.1 hypothetical protein M421DRAFT_309269 [Didymella exigua CBS 183.55]